MIKSIHAITKEPFNRTNLTLLSQQKEIFEIIKIHSQQGGFSVIMGEPGVGKSVLREHIENLEKERDITVVSCSRTMHRACPAKRFGYLLQYFKTIGRIF